MKQALLIIRWIVGLLFIFSGLVKVNDPLGLSFKMNEFFEVWGFFALTKYSLALAIFMNVLEVVCGVAVLIGFSMKHFTKILLVLIVFFTFLTGYALLSGKIKTCGCLGDCLPLTPLQSFLKDLVLLVLIVVLFIYRNKIQPTFKSIGISANIIIVSILGCILLQNQALKHLPFYDCLPYKVGNNIVEQMQKPKNYVPDSTTIIYKYTKNGKPVEFDQNSFPEDFDSTYIYVNRIDKLIKKGSNEPKITSFNLTNLNGVDTTNAIFALPKYVLVFSNRNPADYAKFYKDLQTTKAYCDKNKMPLFYVTSQSDEEVKTIAKEGITILKCDATLIKTAARVNATYFLMKNTTIINKFSYLDFDKVLKAFNTYRFDFTN